MLINFITISNIVYFYSVWSLFWSLAVSVLLLFLALSLTCGQKKATLINLTFTGSLTMCTHYQTKGWWLAHMHIHVGGQSQISGGALVPSAPSPLGYPLELTERCRHINACYQPAKHLEPHPLSVILKCQFGGSALLQQ